MWSELLFLSVCCSIRGCTPASVGVSVETDVLLDSGVTAEMHPGFGRGER